MKYTRRLLIAVVLGLFLCFPITAFLCGKERWVVKVCKDSDAKVLFKDDNISSGQLKNAKHTTVHDMRAFDAPDGLTMNSPRFVDSGAEDHLFTLDATLFNYKWEKPTKKKNPKTGKIKVVGDDDYHLAIKDGSQTMIAEIASKSCINQTPEPLKSMMRKARQDFDAKFGVPSAGFLKKNIARKIRITGVGFFDKIHGQRGVAPNGIEIHPITKIEFLN